MPITGLRTTADFVTNERPENWREGLLLLAPNGKTPLTALTSLMKSASTDDPKFHWWEKKMEDRRLVLGGNIGAAIAGETVVLTLAAGQSSRAVKQGDLLLVEQTKEIVQVYSDPTTALKLVVKRGVGNVAPATVDYDGAGINPNLLVIGSAFEEGSQAPTGVNFDPAEIYNYTQIFRSTLEITNTAAATRLRTEDAVKEAKRECVEIFSNDVERALFWGARSISTINGKPARTTGGINYFIPTANRLKPSSGNLDLDTLDEWLFKIFRYGSTEKMAFCGNRALLALNQAVRKNSSYEVYKGEKEYGMAITRIMTPYGELVMKAHPLFTQLAGGETDSVAYFGHDSKAFVLDMASLRYRYLASRDIKYEPKLQSNELDGMKSGYIGEIGLEIAHAETHFLLEDLNLGVKDT